MSDFKDLGLSTEWISMYAMTNSHEDFAETFNAYRFAPERLKATSLSRYDFMKKHVFEEIEYDQDPCKGQQRAQDSIEKFKRNVELPKRGVK
jgi:hypothetical protein